MTAYCSWKPLIFKLVGEEIFEVVICRRVGNFQKHTSTKGKRRTFLLSVMLIYIYVMCSSR